MDNLPTMATRNSLPTQRRFSDAAFDQKRQDPTLAMELNLNQLLVRQESSTQALRVTGHQWADQGILDGDLVLVDRALQAGSSDLIVAWRDNDARFCRQHQLTPDDSPWGVVTATIHQYR
ncbi:MAG: S24 family peptidase [Patescibacteria group bacterium]|nr:S24 family peptidase [Patescibacteria group bacterium]